MTAARPDRFRLYADEGEGFRPENCLLNLEVAGTVDFDGFVHVAFPVSALQFDPPIESGEFQLESLQIEPLTSLQAFGYAIISKIKLLRKYCHTKQALWRAAGMLCAAICADTAEAVSRLERSRPRRARALRRSAGL